MTSVVKWLVRLSLVPHRLGFESPSRLQKKSKLTAKRPGKDTMKIKRKTQAVFTPSFSPHICSGYRYLRLVKTYENLPLLFVCLIVLLSRSLIVFCFVLSFTLIRYPIQLPELRKKSQLKNNRFLLRSFLHVSPPHPPHHCSLLMDEVSTFLHRTGLELLFSGGLLRGN